MVTGTQIIILKLTFRRFEKPTNERRQGSIPKEAPWKTLVLNEQTHKKWDLRI